MSQNESPYPPTAPVTAIVDPPPQYGLTVQQKEARRLVLGASEIAAVAGIHPYRNALDVYLTKTQPIVARAEDEDEDELAIASEWGHRLETVIAKKYADVHQVSLIIVDRKVHPVEQWMSASPDRMVIRNWGDKFLTGDVIDRGLELKNRSAYTRDQFGPAGTDLVPMDIAAQCHWSMQVFDMEVWDAAVLIGGNYWSWFRIHRDPEIIAALQEKGYDFMHNNVAKRIEPAIDGTKSWKDYITQKFAKHTDVLREGEVADYHLLLDLIEKKQEAKALESQINQLETSLKAQVGDAAGIEWPNGVRFTWKKVKDSTGTDYQAIAFQLAVRLGLTMEQQRELEAQHQVVTKVGSRRIHISIPKELKNGNTTTA